MREEELEYRPDPFGRLGFGEWEARRRRDPFGRLPEDEDEPLAEVRKRWASGEHFRNNATLFELGDSVGEHGANHRLDFAKVQLALHNEGRFDLGRSGGPTGYFSPPLAEAIRGRQLDAGLAVDGDVLPGGETIKSLKTRAAERERDLLGAPLPARPGERATDAERSPTPGVQVASNPMPLVRAGIGLARWLFQQPDARRVAEQLADVEHQIGTQMAAAQSAAAAAGAPDPSGRAPSAATAEPSARETASEDAVRALLALPMSARGDPTTVEGNDIIVAQCRDILNTEFPELAQDVEHEYGATKDGTGKRLSEKYVPNRESARKGLSDRRKGSSHPDFSWTHKRLAENDSRRFAHGNSATMRKDGRTPIAKESRSFAQLAANAGEAFATIFPKLRPGMDRDRYRADVRAKCREAFTKWEAELKKPPESNGDGAEGAQE